MPRSSLFTDRESKSIAALATVSACDHYRTDPPSLRSFLRERLRLSPVESEPVYVRCQNDAAYLQALVVDYIGRLQEMALLAYLAEQRPRTEIAERLGFDPFDPRRQEAYRRAHRPFNTMQGAALAGGSLLGLLLTLVLARFVPRIEQTWEIREKRGASLFAILPIPMPIYETQKKLVKEQADGYGWLLVSEPDSPRVEIARAPLPQDDPRVKNIGEMVTYRYTSYRRDYSWFFGWLLIMWISVFLITVVVVVRLREKKWSAERYAARIPHAGETEGKQWQTGVQEKPSAPDVGL